MMIYIYIDRIFYVHQQDPQLRVCTLYNMYGIVDQLGPASLSAQQENNSVRAHSCARSCSRELSIFIIKHHQKVEKKNLSEPCVQRFVFFPQTVWPHLGVLTVSVKAWCSIEVVYLASGIFPVNFHTKWLL